MRRNADKDQSKQPGHKIILLKENHTDYSQFNSERGIIRMANRTSHMLLAFFVYLGVAIVFVIRAPITTVNQGLYWILLGFALSMFGAELPDYDQLADKIFSHRDIITHSSLVPLLIFLIVKGLAESAVYVFASPLMLFIFLGHASHMFLDLWPVWAGSGAQLKGQKQHGGLQTPVTWLIEGITGEEIYKKLEGTYLMHLPFKIPDKDNNKKHRKGAKEKLRKTLEKGRTRAWLTISGLIDILLAIFVANAFSPFLPFAT
jgi:hypothetical protein